MPARDDAVTVKKILNVAFQTHSIFQKHQLEERSVVKESLTTATDGIRRRKALEYGQS